MTSSIKNIPYEYLCPITQEIMKNPVILIEDGCNYEESALQEWLINYNTSPITNNELIDRTYTPNRALKAIIEDFSRQQISRAVIEEFLAFRIRTGRHSNNDWKERPTIRIMLSLLGASGVGKTALGLCLQYGRLPENMKHPPSSLGTDIQFYYLDRLFQNEYIVIVQLNDPPGQEKYEAVTNNFFRQCHGALLLADASKIATLDRLEKYWYDKLDKLAMNKVQCVLVCTKNDLFVKENEDYRHSFLQQAEKFAFLYQMPIVQVSAYRADNVEYIFKQLIIRIMTDETLVSELIAQAIRRDDLINRWYSSLASSNIIPPGSSGRHERRVKKKHPICCK